MPDLVGGACMPASRVGDSIHVACATQFNYDSVGGFLPPMPKPSNCTGDNHYILQLPAGRLEWSTCKMPNNPPLPWLRDSGARTLSAPELASALEWLDKVTISDVKGPCCCDKPTMTIAVTTPGGKRTYVDDYNACNGGHDPFVRALDGALQAVTWLAHP